VYVFSPPPLLPPFYHPLPLYLPPYFYTSPPFSLSQMPLSDNNQELNIILSLTHEYRQPSPQAISDAAYTHQLQGSTESLKVDMVKRFVGLVVVPGKHIQRIEVEE
jgi:hypothetical protein